MSGLTDRSISHLFGCMENEPHQDMEEENEYVSAVDGTVRPVFKTPRGPAGLWDEPQLEIFCMVFSQVRRSFSHFHMLIRL